MFHQYCAYSFVTYYICAAVYLSPLYIASINLQVTSRCVNLSEAHDSLDQVFPHLKATMCVT
jgi:hypothetical protein